MNLPKPMSSLFVLLAFLALDQFSFADVRFPACGPIAAVPPRRPDCPMVLQINFDYDRFDLKPEALALLETYWECQSRALEGRNDWILEVGGYTDEWGNRAYNIALGERRSRSVLEYFSAKGVAADRIQVVSYGESVPAEQIHSRNAWASNRRAMVSVKFVE